MISSMTDRNKAGALRRWPLILSAVIVLAAVAVMVRLGFWQLDRLAQKEALLARYAAAENLPEEYFEGWLHGYVAANDRVLYRRAWTDCTATSNFAARAGQNSKGEAGWAHSAICKIKGGGPGFQVRVVLGWSSSPKAVEWAGGRVRGTFGPGPRLIADPPLAGLQANAKPDPANIANNHLAYAVQWFLFALTALVIYVLALRTRLGR